MGGQTQIGVAERCIFSDRYIFVAMLRIQGLMSRMDTTIYLNAFAALLQFSLPMKGIIFLDLVTPRECLKRIARRGRSGESQISLEYLEAMDKVQRKYIAQCEREGVSVLRLTQMEDVDYGKAEEDTDDTDNGESPT